LNISILNVSDKSGKIVYEYDELSRLKFVTDQNAPGKTGIADKRVDFGYNDASQPTSVVRRSGLEQTSPEVATTSCLTEQLTSGYDAMGRLTALRHTRGVNVIDRYTWQYDAASRVTQMFGSSDGTANYNGYDATDQLTSASYSYQGNESYSYDDNGNRTGAYTRGTGNRLTSSPCPTGGVYWYQYDDEGNRTARWKDNGDTVLGSNDTDITKYEWDHRNRLRAVRHFANYTAYPNAPDWVVTYAYDAMDRRIRRGLDADGSGGAAMTYTYNVYDGENSLLEYSDADGLGAVSQWASSVVQYSSQDSNSSYYASQALGVPNLQSYGDQPGAWRPSSMNGTTEWLILGYTTQVYADSVTVRENVGNGYVTRIEVHNASTAWETGWETVWSGVDPTVSGALADFTATFARRSYLVDAVRVTIDTSHSTGWEEIDAVELHGLAAGKQGTTLARRNLYGAAVDQVLATDSAAGMVRWGLADHEGTIRDVLNATGDTVLYHIRYDAFGKVTSGAVPAVPAEFNFGYTGRPWDAKAALWDYRARVYDAAVGRFLSEDPSGFSAGDTNLYRYVGNNPVALTDPTGLQSYGGTGSYWTTPNISYSLPGGFSVGSLGGGGLSSTYTINQSLSAVASPGAGAASIASYSGSGSALDPIGFAAGDANTSRYVGNAPTMATAVFFDGAGQPKNSGSIVDTIAKNYQGRPPLVFQVSLTDPDTVFDQTKAASAQVEAILKTNPNEPVDVFGWSRGGVAAILFSSRMAALGKKVRFLGVVDPVAVGVRWDAIECLLQEEIPERERPNALVGKPFWEQHPAPVPTSVQVGFTAWTPPKAPGRSEWIEGLLNSEVFVSISLKQDPRMTERTYSKVGHKAGGFDDGVGYDLYRAAAAAGVPLGRANPFAHAAPPSQAPQPPAEWWEQHRVTPAPFWLPPPPPRIRVMFPDNAHNLPTFGTRLPAPTR
jgi:RHS repeat-associated protein